MIERFQLAKDYSISRVINGCWQLSEGHALKSRLDEQDIMKAFMSLVEKGFTTFDCADIYTGTEELLGRLVNELRQSTILGANDIQIHTKFVPDISLLGALKYDDVERSIDKSLMKQNREMLDLVQFHWWDYDKPGFVDTAGHLQRLKDKGKIRHLAVTNFDSEHLAAIVEAGIEVVSCQTQYSIVDRRPEKKLLNYCMSKNIPQICYGTIAGGLLSEKWIGKPLPSDPDNRSQVKYIQMIEEALGVDNYQRLLILLGKIANRHGVEIAHVATKYILSQEGVAATIVGTRSSRHVESNVRIFTFQLTAEDMEEITSFLGNIPILEGEPFELERTVGSKFREIMKMNLNEAGR